MKSIRCRNVRNTNQSPNITFAAEHFYHLLPPGAPAGNLGQQSLDLPGLLFSREAPARILRWSFNSPKPLLFNDPAPQQLLDLSGCRAHDACTCSPDQVRRYAGSFSHGQDRPPRTKIVKYLPRVDPAF